MIDRILRCRILYEIYGIRYSSLDITFNRVILSLSYHSHCKHYYNRHDNSISDNSKYWIKLENMCLEILKKTTFIFLCNNMFMAQPVLFEKLLI